jgi:hypothetical protein
MVRKKITFLFIILSQFVLAQAPNWSWVKKSTGAINEGFACVTTDSNGNVFAGGSIISNTADFGLGPITNNGYADYVLVKYDASGTPLWIKNGGALGNDIVYNMTTDASGNLYAMVSFQSPSVTFGSFTINNTATVPTIDVLLTYDVALVKYNPNGTVLWVKKIGGLASENSTTVTCDASGNVYVTTFSGSQTLTVGDASVSTTPNNLIGSVLTKIDSQGNTLWIKRFGNDTVYDNFNLTAPVFDASGNLYVTGRFTSETVTLGTITYTNSTPGAQDAFIVKLNPSGTILGQKALQGSVDDTFGAILNIQNELFVPFGVVLFPSTSSAAYSYEDVNYTTTTNKMGLIKMDTDLHLTSFIYNSDISGISVTDATSLYIAGVFSTPTKTFGTTILTNTNSSSVNPSNDIFVAKMNTSGQYLWAKAAGGLNYEDLLGLAIDPTGNLFAAGYFNSTSFVLGSTSITNSSQTDYVDAFVAKLSSTSLSNTDFEKEEIVVYPNPTKNRVTINTNKAIKKITIVDLNGRILDTQFETTVNLTNLVSGIYFLNIETENRISSKKIIKE